jgi:hypothetical protein
VRLRPAWWNEWHHDAALGVAACIVLGALGAVLGALADRRLRRA